MGRNFRKVNAKALTSADTSAVGAKGWMVGANPKSESCVRANSAKRPGASRHGLSRAFQSRRLRWLSLLATLIPLSFTLAQCGKAPSAGSLAANVQGSTDTFDDRFPKPQFKDRFPTAAESFQQRPANV